MIQNICSEICRLIQMCFACALDSFPSCLLFMLPVAFLVVMLPIAFLVGIIPICVEKYIKICVLIKQNESKVDTDMLLVSEVLFCLRQDIPPIVVQPEKIDFRCFV